MKLSILTPGKTVFDGDVSSVVAPGTDGGLEILENHAPLVASLGEGTIAITTTDKENLTFETSGGFIEVIANNISILLQSVKK